MFTTSSASGATSQLVARVLCIICCVQIKVINCQSDQFFGPSVNNKFSGCMLLSSGNLGSVEECLDQCLSYSGTERCNSVNVLQGTSYWNCETLACSGTPPSVASGWNAYTRKPEPPTPPPTEDIYVGPIPRIWTDCQCPPIRHHHDKSYDQCRTLCSDDADCTAINFSDADCILRACPKPVPPPTLRYGSFKGYANEADIGQCEGRTRRCTRNKGKCLRKIAWPTCEGKLDRRMCQGIHCGCCIPQ